MKRLKFGVIGCGRTGMDNGDVIARRRECVIQWVVDVRRPAAEKLKTQLGAAEIYDNWRQAMSDSPVDAVVITVPNHLHAPALIDAAEAGVDVFCEKPIALTLADGRRMIDAAKAAGIRVQVNFELRRHKKWQKVRELIHAGAIGRPVVWRSFVSCWPPADADGKPMAWFMDAERGGGMLLDCACHRFDFWRHTFGPARWVKGTSTRLNPAHTARDVGTCVIQYDSGDRSILSWAHCLPHGADLPDVHDVIGPEGGIIVEPQRDQYPDDFDRENFDAVIVAQGGFQKTFEPYANEPPQTPANNNVNFFVDMLLSGGQPDITLEDAYYALEISRKILDDDWADSPLAREEG